MSVQGIARVRGIASLPAFAVGLVLSIGVPRHGVAEPAWWTEQKKNCRLPANLAYNNWDGTCNGSASAPAATPARDFEAERRAAEAVERQRQQAEADRIERERLAVERRKEEERVAFIRARDEAALTLKGSAGTGALQLKGLSGTDTSGLKGSGFDTSSELKIAPSAGDSVGNASTQRAALIGSTPSSDPNVVDARVPSGLPKALDDAIAGAYPDSPPGVNERVRKGFQAVMLRDWSVAKAWFEDALNHDPGNVGLKRLVALASTPTQPTPQKPFTHEPIPPNSDKRAFAETSMKVHSHEEWLRFLFPDAPVAAQAPEFTCRCLIRPTSTCCSRAFERWTTRKRRTFCSVSKHDLFL